MARDRSGVGIDDALRALDDLVEQSNQLTRLLAAEAERRGTTPDDREQHRHR